MNRVPKMIRLAAVVVAVLAPAGAVRAQAQSDFHFLTDTTNRAQIDDRGGSNDGYSFEMRLDETDSNSENYCPHCRFNLLTVDLGITMSDLERMGIDRADIQTFEGLFGTLNHLNSTPPETLADEAEPGISGPDRAALAATIAAILLRWNLDAALDDLADLATGALTIGGRSVDDIVDSLGIQMDTAFKYNFADPNDLERANTGVAVYTVAEYLAAVGLVNPDMVDPIQTAISSIPIPGAFEISGDDDDANSPASFHGRYTDLTVRQRSYVVNGFNVYLIVYTVVNDSDRVLPFVEAAMIADFDVEPGSSDTETWFEPTNTAVMVYDNMPYEDPEMHGVFGLAGLFPTIPTPFDWILSNWQIDDQLSLSQTSPVSQTNRYKFMFWFPEMSWDQDNATGKSEKQGAVSMRLTLPMLPGDEKPVGFCYAGDVETSRGTAETNTIAALHACRTLFDVLIPNCGDGMLQIGEECDPGLPEPIDGSWSCSLSCTRIVCGDGLLEVGEECDDGNVVPGDGCSDACVVEECGDGVVQIGLGEECDDGNATNTDACLNDCRAARCGDGFLRSCDPATEDCGCAGYAHCMQGTFTFRTGDGTGEFGAMIGHPIGYLFAFDRPAVTALGGGVWHVVTPPMHVEFTGDAYAADRLANGLEGAVWDFTLTETSPAARTLVTNSFRDPDAPALAATTFNIGASGGRDLTWAFPPRGLPYLTALSFSNATFGTRRTVRVLPSLAYESLTGLGSGRLGDSSAATGGEVCDDGNSSDLDACTNLCLPAACGDGLVQPANGEQCDEGAATATCGADCRFVGAVCGDGTMQTGEECDDGNTTDGDTCSSLCLDERCGDGIVQTALGEECDDGANGDNDGCTDTCIAEVCGDGVQQGPLGEECDDGAANDDTAACTSDCHDAHCGDGLVQTGVDECDDGNHFTGDGCTRACVIEFCGDGLPGPDEDCDDGNVVDGDGCTATCAREYCGDGVLQAAIGEQCDDGNVAAGDGCSRDCRLENLADCGNGRLDTGEQCDDGNTSAGDGCGQYCQLENPDLCGNGRTDPGERCDDGNDVNGDGCSSRCSLEACGDGIQQTGERCDDGNTTAGDGCDADCMVEASTCGNGIHEYGEQCDDGNTDLGDGCSPRCTVEDPSSVSLADCGNGTLDFGEECDDGGRVEGDGCGETCRLESAICGNGRLERGELCDDGNDAVGDACSPTCEPSGGGVCGDGTLDPGERCDDGNTVAGDGCSPTCMTEPVPVPTGDTGCGCAVTGAAGGSLLTLLGLVAVSLLRRRRR